MTADPLATDPDVLALQRVVAGRYTVERELGRGGMGLVLLARDAMLERRVAIKLLPGALAAAPGPRARFLREARIGAGLSHPHVVPIHAVEEHPAVVFFAMGYVEGETLAERVRRAGPLPPGEVARVLREVAWALAYAHGRGVVHRDVKPDNVMIERGTGRALVSDFGIARTLAAPSALTGEGEILGSVAFMSPEQAAGEPVDGRSDLYALGGVGFYALTGRPPFEASSAAALLVRRLTVAAPPVASVRPDVAPRVAAVVDRCLARAPEARFASAEAVAEALAGASAAAGAPDIAPAVRSFMRAAEQTLSLVWIVAVFTLLYGLPTVRRLGPLVAAIVFGVAVLAGELLRRARELLDEGYGAADVHRAFALERRAHDEELRALFDARRTAARRQTRRRAWAAVVVGLALKVGVITLFGRAMPGGRVEPLLVAANVLTDLLTAVSLVIAVNTSPRAERRYLRAAARVWQSRFGPLFFRAAAIGRRRTGTGPGTPAGVAADGPVPEALPAAVAARFPDLPRLLRQLEEAYATLGAREGEVARAVAAAGIPATAAADDGDERLARGDGHDDGGVGRTASTAAALVERRGVLVADMRAALDAIRAQRTAVAAARENVRVQLLRIGAGLGAPDDLAEELASARALLAAAAATGARGGVPVAAVPAGR